jgi:hypothetical protein
MNSQIKQVIQMKLRYLFLPILLASSMSASANGYVGFSYGSTSVKADLSSIGGSTLDDTTTLTKFYGGYRFHKYVALEAAWFDLASVSVGQVGSGSTAVSGYVDMKALGIYGVAFVPFGKHVSAFIKAGGASWDADLQVNSTTAGADGFDALYGLGVSYNFTKTFAVTADWETIDSPNPEFSTYSLGFKWDFK